jgi:hypothetical protein
MVESARQSRRDAGDRTAAKRRAHAESTFEDKQEQLKMRGFISMRFQAN